jgi:hypothetical protein
LLFATLGPWKASFAAQVSATVLAAVYHAGGSLSFGLLSSIKAMQLWMEGSRPRQNFIIRVQGTSPSQRRGVPRCEQCSAIAGMRGGEGTKVHLNMKRGDGASDGSLQSHSGANPNPKRAKNRGNVPKGGKADGVALTGKVFIPIPISLFQQPYYQISVNYYSISRCNSLVLSSNIIQFLFIYHRHYTEL